MMAVLTAALGELMMTREDSSDNWQKWASMDWAIGEKPGRPRKARVGEGVRGRTDRRQRGTGRGRWNGRESVRLDWICDAGWPIIRYAHPLPSAVSGSRPHRHQVPAYCDMSDGTCSLLLSLPFTGQ